MSWVSQELKKKFIELALEEYKQGNNECYIVYTDKEGKEHKEKGEVFIDELKSIVDYDEDDEPIYEAYGYALAYEFNIPEGSTNVYAIHNNEKIGNSQSYDYAGTFHVTVFSIG